MKRIIVFFVYLMLIIFEVDAFASDLEQAMTAVYDNNPAAFKMLKSLSDSNRADATALLILSEYYKHGSKRQGAMDDNLEAIRLTKLALVKAIQSSNENDIDLAENNLQYFGYDYDRGEGVPRNYAAAFDVFKFLAERGYSHAQVSISDYYEKGKAVKKDPIEAYKWLSLAFSQKAPITGNWDYASLDRLEKQLSSEQLTEAQRRANSWKPVR